MSANSNLAHQCYSAKLANQADVFKITPNKKKCQGFIDEFKRKFDNYIRIIENALACSYNDFDKLKEEKKKHETYCIRKMINNEQYSLLKLYALHHSFDNTLKLVAKTSSINLSMKPNKIEVKKPKENERYELNPMEMIEPKEEVKESSYANKESIPTQSIDPFTLSTQSISEYSPTSFINRPIISSQSKSPFIMSSYGLKNIGNSCYFNTALQILKFAYPFSHYLKVHDFNRSFSKALANAMNEMWSALSPVNPANLFNELSKKNSKFIKGDQYDSYEALTSIISIFYNENHVSTFNEDIKLALTDYTEINVESVFGYIYQLNTFQKSIVSDLFTNIGLRVFWCNSCDCKKSLMETRIGFELDMKPKIKEAFSDFFGDRKCTNFRCSKCKKTGNVTINYKWLSNAPILLFQLKRFTKSGKYFSKNIDNIDIDEHLDVNAYLSVKTKSSRYTLIAVGNHSGSLSGGHYYAYGYDLVIKSWKVLNDSSATKIDHPNLDNAITLMYLRDDMKEYDTFSNEAKLSILNRISEYDAK